MLYTPFEGIYKEPYVCKGPVKATKKRSHQSFEKKYPILETSLTLY